MKQRSFAIIALLALLLVGAAALAQQKLPAKAPCAVCSMRGEEHGPEKVVAASEYQGKTYYFCSKNCQKAFDADPSAWMPPVLPRPAPKFALKDVQGAEAGPANWKGQVVLVDFWATWCKPCVAAMPSLQKLHDKYAPKGFRVVGISIDEEGEKKVKPFLAKRKFTYPMLLDSAETWKAFGVRAIPAVFLINREGRIVKQWTGEVEKKKKEIEQSVAALLEAPKKDAP